jgi:C4-type Zn-finger protein
LNNMREGKRKFTMILNDPLAHTFISNPYLPNEDKGLKI